MFEWDVLESHRCCFLCDIFSIRIYKPFTKRGRFKVTAAINLRVLVSTKHHHFRIVGGTGDTFFP